MTMSDVKQISAPNPHPAIALPRSAISRAMANAISWTTSATIALITTARRSSGAA